ncbi:MAG: hypothetical protein Q9160_003384 [Pyrenula sp. 1 TL-2023]
MTTLKPHLIRADTLDLQAHDTPSAKDHTKQPTHPAPLGVGPAAPHQNQTLRRAEEEADNDNANSPRVGRNGSFPEEPDFFDDNDDPNGQHESDHASGNESEEGEYGDQDGDDDLDDDMMDKISSSPSIDDGKYTLPPWPKRSSSLGIESLLSSISTPPREAGGSSSSPFTSPPEHFPLLPFEEKDKQTPVNHYHLGEYVGREEVTEGLVDSNDTRLQNAFEVTPSRKTAVAKQCAHKTLDSDEKTNDSGELRRDLSLEDIQRFLLPLDDPILDNAFDKANLNNDYDNDDADPDEIWEDMDELEGEALDSEDDDDTEDFTTDDPRFIDSGWGGECLRDPEDIDFEFVYALHTFVATVEGQANATKGDTMVLLDDSNSYWWLVRVVKDGSIGYLPAEHIETPTERLARLNKHRNIDLSATMLGDNPEKSKNPLKKAMRRRNAKTVQFAAPQYFEPSIIEYSDEEEEGSDIDKDEEEDAEMEEQESQEDARNDEAIVEPLRVKSQSKPGLTNGIKKVDGRDESSNGAPEDSERGRTSEEIFEKRDESRSRNGTVRNTDSFFKDDTVETKKISLTPRLLRNSADASNSAEAQEIKSRGSSETFEKISGEIDRAKDEKKKKEKKPGMLSGLFKRKEKKGKQESEIDEFEKVSEDSPRLSPTPKDTNEGVIQETRLSIQSRSPQRHPSKLQKQPPPTSPPKTSPTKDGQQAIASPHDSDGSYSIVQPNQTGPSTLRSVPSETQPVEEPAPLNVRSSAPRDRVSSPQGENRPAVSPYGASVKSSRTDPAPQQVSEPLGKPSASTPAQDPFASEETESESDDDIPVRNEQTSQTVPTRQPAERLSESPVHVSPIESNTTNKFPPQPTSKPPPLMVDTSSSKPPRSTSQNSPSDDAPSSPSLVEAETPRDNDQSTDQTTTSPHADAATPSTTRSTPSWSDASLRTYMDDDSDIRDLLIIVHDNSNVIPAGPEHPITGNLFNAEKTRLAEMQSNLDSMLTGWLAKKSRSQVSSAA